MNFVVPFGREHRARMLYLISTHMNLLGLIILAILGGVLLGVAIAWDKFWEFLEAR